MHFYHLTGANSFKTGTMSTNNGFTLNLADWIIIIECDMEIKEVTRDPKEGESAADRAQREQFEDSFLVPGDYRVERLYVKLTCKLAAPVRHIPDCRS
jgi:hypothetical protein